MQCTKSVHIAAFLNEPIYVCNNFVLSDLARFKMHLYGC